LVSHASIGVTQPKASATVDAHGLAICSWRNFVQFEI